MSKDWAAVAEAINTRMAELGMTQLELATRSRVAVATIRAIQRAEPKQRNPRTLADLSEALGWPSRQLENLANGAGAATSVDRVAVLESQVSELQQRVAALENET